MKSSWISICIRSSFGATIWVYLDATAENNGSTSSGSGTIPFSEPDRSIFGNVGVELSPVTVKVTGTATGSAVGLIIFIDAA